MSSGRRIAVRATFRSKGSRDTIEYSLQKNSKVVIYYGNDWVSPTTRIIFTIDYAGLGDRIRLLDGDF